MKTILSFFAAVVAVSALSSFCTWNWLVDRQPASADDSHAWLHQELHTTPEQLKALAPIEARHAERDQILREQLRQAKRELAAAIAKSKAMSPEVTAAVEKVHRHMGELQKASLDHLFAMRSVLTTAQDDRLLELAEKGLAHGP